MLLKFNQAVDLTVEMNDTFYTEAKGEFIDKECLYDLYRQEAALYFKRTTDFRTMAESVPFIKGIGIRYNWQMNVTNNYDMLIVVNLN